MKVSEQFNEILDRVFAEPEPSFTQRFAKKVGFEIRDDEMAELNEKWRIVENANEQRDRFSINSADRDYRELAAQQEVRIDRGEPLELLPDRLLFSLQYQTAFATATQGRLRGLKKLRETARPIAHRFASVLRNEARSVDSDHAAKSADYGLKEAPSEVAEHLRREADAVEELVDRAETVTAMLPWTIGSS